MSFSMNFQAINFQALSEQVATADWSHPSTDGLPATLADWLTDAGSLTTKLQQHGDAFNVRVLRHAVGRVSESECELLNLVSEPDCSVQVREVLLCNQQTPWVFARSLIPQVATLEAYQAIGEHPLGHLLFNDPVTQVGPFELAAFTNPNEGATDQLWGRRRAFSVTHAKVIVAEVFLPQAPCYGVPARSVL